MNETYGDIQVTPLNSEKYLYFQVGNLRFIDSFQFFPLNWKTSCRYC